MPEDPQDTPGDSASSPGALLPEVAWQLEGRLVEASNVALRMAARDSIDSVDSAGASDTDTLDDTTPRAVYKPVAGERPLADFPEHTLAHREVAAWIVAHVGGWTCIPETRWYSGEFGDGSLQRWVGPIQPEEQDVVDLLEPAELDANDGWCPIAAFEGDDGPLILAHADDARLRAIAALDVVLANADRKGSHIIEADGQLYAIDNGLSFHVDDKLRTVLWGWAGEPLGEEITACLERLVAAGQALDDQLADHLSVPEIEALHARIDALLAAGTFPDPPEDRYGLPWPPL